MNSATTPGKASMVRAKHAVSQSDFRDLTQSLMTKDSLCRLRAASRISSDEGRFRREIRKDVDPAGQVMGSGELIRCGHGNEVLGREGIDENRIRVRAHHPAPVEDAAAVRWQLPDLSAGSIALETVVIDEGDADIEPANRVALPGEHRINASFVEGVGGQQQRGLRHSQNLLGVRFRLRTR